MKFFWCWVWLLSASAGWAGLAVIRTTDGRHLAGEWELAGGVVTFTPTNGSALTLALADIAQGQFNDESARRSEGTRSHGRRCRRYG